LKSRKKGKGKKAIGKEGTVIQLQYSPSKLTISLSAEIRFKVYFCLPFINP